MRSSTTRILVLVGLVLALGVVMNWTRQFIPGSTPSVVLAQTKGKLALDAARLALNQAISNEKLNPTKESALAAEAALETYNAAVAVRIEEINASLKDLEQLAAVNKTSLIVQQIEALEAESSSIQAPTSPTPVVTPETEPNNTSATANTINVSASAQPCAIVSGAINPGGDLDFFTFTGAPAGSRIWIETDTGGTQNAGATSRDTVIDLLAADGTTVIENDDDDGTGNGGDGTVETGLASMIGGRTLTAGGTYFIKVRAFSGTGIVNPYRLFVVLTNVAGTAEAEANNTSATANTIVTAGSPVGLRTGAIGAAGDADYYSVVATVGNSVYFNVDADPERDGTGTDLVVEFRDPSDVLLLSVDSSITGSLANPAAEGANFTIATSGTYFIKVRHFSATGTGTYHIMVAACSSDTPSVPTPTIVNEIEPNNTCGTAQVLTLGTQNCAIVAGSVNPSSDVDFYRIDGVAAGSKFWGYVDTGGTQNPGATSRDSTVTLFAADCTTQIEFDDDDGTGNGGDSTVETTLASCIGGGTLTVGGTYFIKVAAFSTGIVNPYKLFIVVTPSALPVAEAESNNTTATANPIVTGAQMIGVRTGAIGTAGDADFYSIVATAGNVLYFNCDDDPARDFEFGIDGVLDLFAPDGTTVLLHVDSDVGGSLAAESASFNISTSGTYFLRVTHFDSISTGNYQLMVSACSGPTALPCVLTCPANITKSNDPNQCGAVVTYPAPTSTGTCGTITCSPASQSFFPVGTTTVTCQAQTTGGGTFPSAGKLTGGDAAPAVCTPQTITQSSSQAITTNNSVSCNATGIHVENSYYRAFTLSSFGITTQYDIASVDIGVELAKAGGTAPTPGKPSISANAKGKAFAPGATTQPITIKLYTSSMPFPTGFPGSLTQIGITNTTVNDAANTVVNIPVTGSAPAGSQLVVEVLTPDGRAAGNSFFIGSNAAAETGPSYLRAPLCGVTTPTTTAAIGFPNMHIVMNVKGCQQVAGGGPTCSFTVRVNDTQRPVITCPANITVVTATVNDPCTVVNYTTTASDNCPGVTVVCNPPSGSCFPVGVTTVTCTATDASGNTAPCSFTVSVFNGRLQDDFESCNNTVLFNTISGAYRWCCHGTVFTGVAKVTKLGNTFKLEHNAVDRRVLINLSAGSFPPSGNASLQSPPGTIRCVIQDRDTRNDTCICGAAPPPPV